MSARVFVFLSLAAALCIEQRRGFRLRLGKEAEHILSARIFAVLRLLAALCVCTSATAQEKRVLDEATARKYATAWANKVYADVRGLQESDGGGFFGMLGSLGFEYLPSEGSLAVRAYIFPRDAELTTKPDLLPWLNNLAAEDPESVSNGFFETLKAPWERDKQPSLFLRIDLTDGSKSVSAVMSRLEKLRADSMVWRGDKFTRALDDLRKQRQKKAAEQQP